VFELFFYFVAMHENSDATDTAQLVTFFRGTEEYFKIVTELTAIVPIKGSTKATDLYTALQNTLRMCQLKINSMSALTTDGAPALLRNRGVVATMIKKERRRDSWEH
jgi:hypothetical protein